ncbi:GNAT family N-acetyltransferase [Myxococcaceae bacterium JPH2]|nr:GNAT family N-acetyltransferase [Myxococcaceae bacterium JPH2]
MDVTYRIALPEDFSALELLMAAQFHDEEIAVDSTRLTRVIRPVLDWPERGFFVLAHTPEGQPVGAAYVPCYWSLEHEGMAAWLEEIYVLAAYRGAGVGTGLVRAACTEAAARGCLAVDLEVGVGQERVAHLYVREGFQPLQRDRWVRRLREA